MEDKVDCLSCRGGGRMSPTATGFESAASINEWLMQQPCPACKGTGKVSKRTRRNQEKQQKD